jgi:hypothetical protein
MATERTGENEQKGIINEETKKMKKGIFKLMVS